MKALILISFFTMFQSIAADSASEETISVRSDRRVGFQVLHMGAPFRQVLGVGGAVNFAKRARARVILAPGLSSVNGQNVESLHTVVFGVDGFLLSGALSPMVSLQSAFTRGSDHLGDAFGRDARHFLVAVGADFLRSDGLNAGAALNLPINEPVSGISFYLGWYSNLI